MVKPDNFVAISQPDSVLRAKELIAKSFSGETATEFTEGTIDAALRLCEKKGGLFLYPREDPESLLLFFRYWPTDHKAVVEMDYCRLEETRLDGPLLHIVAMIERQNAFTILRKLIETLNPWGVTAHRWDKRRQGWRLVTRKNVRFDKEVWNREQLQRCTIH